MNPLPKTYTHSTGTAFTEVSKTISQLSARNVNHGGTEDPLYHVATEKMYFVDSELYETDAHLMKFGTDEKGSYLVPNRTVFYPQGGGQPWDTGTVTLLGIDHEPLRETPITAVLDHDNEIRHYFEPDGASKEILEKTQLVQLKINSELRKLHCRLHTGGHLVSHLVAKLVDGAKVASSQHWPDSCRITFSEVAEKNLSFTLAELKNMINTEIASYLENPNNKIEIQIIANPEQGIKRSIKFADFDWKPCGGTHVKRVGDIGAVEVTKLKMEKDRRLGIKVLCASYKIS